MLTKGPLNNRHVPIEGNLLNVSGIGIKPYEPEFVAFQESSVWWLDEKWEELKKTDGRLENVELLKLNCIIDYNKSPCFLKFPKWRIK